MFRRIALLLLVFPMLAVACSDDDEQARPPTDTPRELELRLALAANLEPFDGCDQLLGYFRDSAEELNVGVGVGAPLQAEVMERGATAVAGAEAGDTAAAEAPATGGPVGDGDGFSQTNIQEAGVDEPDVVKTDGERIVAVAQGRLQVVEPSGAGTRVLGSVTLPEGSHELFLYGDRAIVLTRSWQAIPMLEGGSSTGSGGSTGSGAPVGDVVGGDVAVASPVIGAGSSTTIVSAVDLSDAASPQVTDSVTLEGDYFTARLHEGVIRLVLHSYPTMYEQPADAPLEAFLPDQIVGEGDEARIEPLVPCESVARPPEPSGVGTVTVLTIDAAGPMQPIDSDAVVADAQTVYASTETLYVGTSQWYEPNSDPNAESFTTELHAFDISDSKQTTYVASGRVRGQMLSQWSLSEFEDHLRVATTDGSPWVQFEGQEPSSESFVTVFTRNGDQLETVGQLGGLGRGETIHAVRYIGTLGFVVTFRQTDPLYAVDLSEPTDPRLLGELKIPGFSAYLHPIGDGRMVGVGQDATDEGQVLGTQVSLFDIADPSALRRLDQAGIEGAHSAVEFDHKAFLWWGKSRLAVLPIEIYGSPVGVPGVGAGSEPGGGAGAEPDAPPVAEIAPVQSFLGAAAFRVTNDDVELVGRVTHEGKVAQTTPPGEGERGVAPADAYYYGGVPIQRALVVGDTLYTVSEIGVMASSLDGFGEQGWAGF